jgi:hypothetical protein
MKALFWRDPSLKDIQNEGSTMFNQPSYGMLWGFQNRDLSNASWIRVRLRMGYITKNGDTVCGRGNDKELDLGVPYFHLLAQIKAIDPM